MLNRQKNTPAINLQSLSHKFNQVTALSDINLNIMYGDAVVLFGHNGAGKSTLLRILATLIKPTEGSIEIAGMRYPQQRGLIRGITGYLGHQYFLYGDLTPKENLRFYANLFSVERVEIRIEEVLEIVGMQDVANRRIKTFSNGMQKRISLARALIHKPKILLLDEPEAGLDQESLTLLGRILKEFLEGGACIVMATHDLDFGLNFSSRTILLKRGRIIDDTSSRSTNLKKLKELLSAHDEFRS